MDRREFFRSASVLGIAAGVAAQASHRITPILGAEHQNPDSPSGGDVTCHPDESGVMKGAPPPEGKQVTRGNHYESQAKMRWAMQHWRELFPTQRVGRSNSPIILPRKKHDIRALTFLDTRGQATSVGRQLDHLDVDAISVLKHGKIAFEEYRHGMTPETPHATQSVYKSIVATVIATLIGEGSLEEGQTIESYVPELQGTALDGASIRQLLDMESGIKYEYVGPDNEFGRHIQSIGPEADATTGPVGNHQFMLALEKERRHGERMRYKEADPLALAWAAEKVTSQRFADLLHERVWARMGAEFDADATCDKLCQWTFFLSLTLRDLARWGLMCLNNGIVDGEQVVPACFFNDIRTKASVEKLAEVPLLGKLVPEGVGYRSFFYHHRKSSAIAAIGGLGQFCYINREYGTVVALFSTTPPWVKSDTPPEDFEEEDIFKRECRRERERWHLCKEIAKG